MINHRYPRRRIRDAHLEISDARLRGGILGGCPPVPPGIYRFLACSGKGLIGRAVTSPPDLAVCKAPDRRSGRIPALPYLPLEQRMYFPFPFPVGSIGRETGNGSLS